MLSGGTTPPEFFAALIGGHHLPISAVPPRGTHFSVQYTAGVTIVMRLPGSD